MINIYIYIYINDDPGAQDVLEIMKTLAERNEDLEDLNSRGSELTRT